ncbi:hypothetical protein EG329_010190 [Mollisiaceae sp. DMI_Dod_QoI]|nr:hypothetical protein EG329_010190 [Helotiales sp. DMI_Dod_QoI]
MSTSPPSGPALKTAIVFPGMFHKPPFSLEVPGVERVNGETIPRRNAKYLDGLLSRPKEDIATLYDVLKYSRDTYGDASAMGSRRLIATHTEPETEMKESRNTHRPWTYYEMGPYKYESYKDYFQLAMDIGAGFRELGLNAGDRVHIFAATSMRWLAVSHGATVQSMPIVTSYATLGEAGLEHSLVQTKAKAIFVDGDLLSKLDHPLVKAKDLKFVIYNDEHQVNEEDISRLQVLHAKLTILSYSDFLQKGRVREYGPVRPCPDDLCCIMYTSGTTGTPKGVPLTHRNVVAAIAGLDSIFKDYVGPDDSVLSYLPLAHSFEYAFENTCLYWGMKMAYGNPRTLTDRFMKNCKGDIKECKPTIMVGVPAIWDQVHKGIKGQIEKNWLSKMIFTHALSLKTWLCRKQYPGVRLLDALVFKSVKDQFGGRLRACFNGAGPLNKDTRSYISHTVAPLISGYGLTETVAMGALQDPLEWTSDTLGDIPGCIEIKLVDYPEAGYFAKDNTGEIWIRGDVVMQGYYENDEETQAAMAPNGWFKTGDIGTWASNGHLKIIDRKKNLIKTSNGEYVALENLESIYRGAKVALNVCIYAAEEQNNILAIVVPRHEAIEQFANDYQAEALQGSSYTSLLDNEIVNDFVLKDLQAEAKKAKLAQFETVKTVILSDQEWTDKNGLLTPAQKLQRRQIYSLFQERIQRAYE